MAVASGLTMVVVDPHLHLLRSHSQLLCSSSTCSSVPTTVIVNTRRRRSCEIHCRWVNQQQLRDVSLKSSCSNMFAGNTFSSNNRNRRRRKQQQQQRGRWRREKQLVVVAELGGQYDDTFEDVKKQLVNYFTYKAVRTVLNQLYEMNPTQYRWFYDFVVTNNPMDGKVFIRALGKEKHELAERVMITRLHLYSKWIKKYNHADTYKEISDQNLELMRERLMETVKWLSDDSNTETIG